MAGSSSLVPFSFEGGYRDDAGEPESLVWRVVPIVHASGLPGYELRTEIRGVPCRSSELDDLETGDAEAAVRAGLTLDRFGRLQAYCVWGELPCTLTVGNGAIGFELDRRRTGPNLRLWVDLAGRRFEVVHEWFEDGLQRLQRGLPAGTELVCCLTCLYSDYSPAGHGLMGMACHRGVKEQYLAVRSKAEYWSVPVTEQVMETHLCAEYTRRRPGTGYRG